jgi:hypothetical protein
MKLGGETREEQADFSQRGYANGELYLTASDDGGLGWSVPINLTDTRSPGCTSNHPDSICGSEAWATIARDVEDIHILYLRDFEAGPWHETPWSINRLMYLNFPGGTTDAPHLCPENVITCVCDCHGDPECDGVTDILDVTQIVDEAFRHGEPPADADCTHSSRNDLNCNCIVDVLDVVSMVNHAFRGDTRPFCDPCLEPCP